MYRGLVTILVMGIALLLTACVGAPTHPLYRQSPEPLPITADNYSDYLTKTRRWLQQNRVMVSDDHRREITANMPFAVEPHTRTGKGILLVHGLGDSPYSFVDIAPALAKQGFLVHTMLLPGHGSRPGDMLKVGIDDWRRAVAEQIRLLRADADEIYLGGFSTGANLVTEYAVNNPEIAGLVLLSPGFKSNSRLDRYLPLVSALTNWLYEPPEARYYLKNFAKYDVVPANGFTQFYYSSDRVLDSLASHYYDGPTFMVLSEDDSVLDVQRIRRLFSERFRHPHSRLLWYGDLPPENDPQIIRADKRLPALRISNYSHMGVLFAPTNPHYGRKAAYRLCQNGQRDEDYVHCRDGNEVWYSAWGYREPDKAHARLTYNPQFAQMLRLMAEVFATAGE